MTTETTTRWRFAADHPVFAGHFPGQPIVPGALLLDRVVHHVAEQHAADGQVVVIEQAKFLRPVGPDETVDLDLQTNTDTHTRWRFTLRVGDQTAANGVLSIAEAAAEATS